jgi:hypothetical protein
MVDYTALALVERLAPQGPRPHPNESGVYPEAPPVVHYVVRHLHRYPHHTSYVEVVNGVVTLLRRPELAGGPATLLVDTTGVGRGVVDNFKHIGARPKAVTIHGGSRTTSEGDEWHVPKKDLVFALVSLAQARPVRLALSDQLPFAQEIRREMQSFTAKINPETAHESFLAWREQDHDDLLLALAMACWWGSRLDNVGRVRMLPLRF